jgi:glutaredoxin
MQLILFGTSACHLCEQADESLHEILAHYPKIQLEIIDIAEQTQWQEKYAIRIPVLFHPQSQQELGWPFDQVAIVKFINELNND